MSIGLNYNNQAFQPTVASVILEYRPRSDADNAASDQRLNWLLKGISIWNKIKMKTYTRHSLNEKSDRPIDIGLHIKEDKMHDGLSLTGRMQVHNY